MTHWLFNVTARDSAKGLAAFPPCDVQLLRKETGSKSLQEMTLIIVACPSSYPEEASAAQGNGFANWSVFHAFSSDSKDKMMVPALNCVCNLSGKMGPESSLGDQEWRGSSVN